MKRGSLASAELVTRPYGLMRMLAGGANLKTSQVDLRILEIRPGERTTRHKHHRSESVFYVLEGLLEMEVGGADTVVGLKAGDVIVIEPHEVHCLRNIGSQGAVVLEAMGPPFSKRDIFYLPPDDQPTTT